LKLELKIDGQIKEVEFSATGPATRLTFNGQLHEAQVSEPEPDLFIIIIKGRVYRCELEKLPNGETEVIVNGERISVTARDRKHLRSRFGPSSIDAGLAILTAPMPGKVMRILLKPGDEVAEHQGVLIVEAMKMQNEVQSPKAGKVLEVRVSEGQTVNSGETLAVVE
jgi:biotin carboxyl carrier protein